MFHALEKLVFLCVNQTVLAANESVLIADDGLCTLSLSSHCILILFVQPKPKGMRLNFSVCSQILLIRVGQGDARVCTKVGEMGQWETLTERWMLNQGIKMAGHGRRCEEGGGSGEQGWMRNSKRTDN